MSIIDLNYYAQSMSQSNGILDKVFPALLGVAVGFGLNWSRDFIKQKKEINDNGNEFLIEIDLIKSVIEKEIESLSNSIDFMKNPGSSQTFMIDQFVLTDKGRIKSINRLHIYHFFRRRFKFTRKESRATVNKIYVLLNLVDYEGAKLKEAFDQYRSRGADFTRRYNKGLGEFAHEHAMLGIRVKREGKKIEDDKLINGLLEHMTNVKEGDKMNFVQITEKFCTPLMVELQKHSDDLRYDILSEKLTVCFGVYHDFINEKNNFIGNLSRIKQSFEDINTKFIEVNEILGRPNA